MSRLTRDDYIEMRRCNERPGVPLSVKEMEQIELDRQKAEYFARGGKICGVSPGVSGFCDDENVKSMGGRAEDKFKGTLGIKDAAKYCGVSIRCLGTHLAKGSGPAFTTIERQRRFVKSSLDSWMKKKRKAA